MAENWLSVWAHVIRMAYDELTLWEFAHVIVLSPVLLPLITVEVIRLEQAGVVGDAE